MRNFAQTLIDWEWVVLLLLIPLTLFPLTYSSFFLITIPLLWLLRRLATGHFVTPTAYDVAMLLLLLMLGVSFLIMFDATVSGPKIAGILLGVALFYGTAGYSRSRGRRLWPVLVLVLGTGTAMAVVGLIGTQWLPPFEFLNRVRTAFALPGGIPGAVDGLVNANELGGTLAWIVPLAGGCLLGAARWHNRRRLVAVALLTVTVLFTGSILLATLSRGAVLAVAAGLILVALFYVSPRWRVVMVIAAAVALLAVFSYGSSRFGRDIVGDPLGLSGRLEIWSRALLGIADFPLTGMGVNSFRRVVTVLYPLYGIPPEIDLGHAHNHLLQTALDLGLPGLVSYLAIWFISAGLLWRTQRELVARHATRHPYYGLTAGLAGALLAGWIFGIFDAVALGARPSFLWWLLLGLTASVHHAVVYSGERLKKRRHAPVHAVYPEIVLPPPPSAAPPPERLTSPIPARPTTSSGRYSGTSKST